MQWLGRSFDGIDFGTNIRAVCEPDAVGASNCLGIKRRSAATFCGSFPTANLYYCGYVTHTTAALLPNGDLVIWGSTEHSCDSEFYNPSTNIWQATHGQLYGGIYFGPLASLATGKVLLAGTEYGVSSNSMLYDPSTNYWTLTGSLNQARGGHTLTGLLNGQVLAAGGQVPSAGATRSAELYTP